MFQLVEFLNLFFTLLKILLLYLEPGSYKGEAVCRENVNFTIGQDLQFVPSYFSFTISKLFSKLLLD